MEPAEGLGSAIASLATQLHDKESTIMSLSADMQSAAENKKNTHTHTNTTEKHVEFKSARNAKLNMY